MNPSIAILIPALNAEDSIAAVLEGCRRQNEWLALVVVDDGSEDATGRIAESSGARVIRHSTTRGKGAALRTGFSALLRDRHCDAVLTLDADGQHDPSDIPAFLRVFQERHAAVVVGSRERWNGVMPLTRSLSNTITSFLVSARTGTHIADSQSGFRLISRRVLERITLEADGFEAETEFLIKAARQGYSIDVVRIKTVYAGERSHMTHWSTTKAFVTTLFREY